jgi:hypothetical protein
MPVQNYNGDGEWSVDSVVRRYETYCRQLHVPEQRILLPKTHTEGDSRWIYPIMDAVIQGIKEDDPACTELGIDFISESKGFPFGMTLKSKAARALRKATLSARQEDRIRTRVATMLIEGYLPQEYRFYSRLLRRTGLGEYQSALLSISPRSHRMREYVHYVHLLSSGCA